MSDIGRRVPDHASGPEEITTDREICVCGDYRHQHRNGTGDCLLGSLRAAGDALHKQFDGWAVSSEQLEALQAWHQATSAHQKEAGE